MHESQVVTEDVKRTKKKKKQIPPKSAYTPSCDPPPHSHCHTHAIPIQRIPTFALVQFQYFIIKLDPCIEFDVHLF